MEDAGSLKTDVQDDIRETAKLIGLLSIQYRDDPPLDATQRTFLSLSVHVGRAPDIPLQ
jgi:hypothetical protein